jgi:predicted alpha/beta-fold hydrolase
VENEGNKFPFADPTGIMVNMSNELNEDLKELLKEELIEELKKNIQKQPKEYQNHTNKKLEKTQKQLNELREDFNKL